MRKYRSYTDEDVKVAVSEAFSVAETLGKLGLKQAGGNYAHLAKTIQRLEIDTSHWTGQSWSRDKRLKDWSLYSKSSNMRKHLIEEAANTCSKCENSEWLGLPIPLEVHHKDGDRTNNCRDNLEVVCPNCHALTKSWRRPKDV